MRLLPSNSECNSTFLEPEFPLGCAGISESWYAVCTRSRHEKSVNRQLEEKGLTTYLPLVRELHRWSDRKKLVEQPIFPGYVFVRTVNLGDSRVSVLQASGVVGFVGAQGKGLPIPDKQIEDIRTLLVSEVPFTHLPFLRVGQRVRIRGGCLDGMEGILSARNSDRSVVVSVEILQRSLAIRVSGFDLEMI
jgi:transcription termination/antitermination protein NusG